MISRTILQMTLLPGGVRSRMARRLRGRVSTANIRALIRSLNDKSDLVRTASLEALVPSGATGASALIAETVNESSLLRSRIAFALGRFGVFPQTIRALTGLLRDPSPLVQAAAANSLGEVGMAAAPAVEALTRLAKGNDLNTAVAAVKALGRIDLSSPSSLPVLVSLIAHNDRPLRTAAIGAISAMISSSKGEIDATKFTSQLLPMLSHRDPTLRETAAQLCGAIGPGAQESIPALIELSRDMTVGVRLATASALVAIAPGDSQIFRALIALTQDKEWSVREIATRGFRGFGPAAKNAVPRLKALLNDEYVRVRIAAIEAVVAIGHSARYLFDDLYVRMFDNHDEIRQAALSALGEMAPLLDEFFPVLIQELQSPEEVRRLTAIEVVKAFGDHGIELIPYLLDCQHDDSLAIQRAISEFTGKVSVDRRKSNK